MAELSSSATLAPREGEYQVVARRYRPQTFAELVGQEHVAQALAGAISSNRVGHAYLFTGARGVGKTSAARILAKALNCPVNGPSPTPCNQCDICQAISSGDDVDVLEIDGASNRGIDEMRELRHNVNVRPSRSRFKIYIIDEVHMLTREAFNALLKTLEEPPEHVKFIFCTTEPEKIPITILSRCQRFDFAGIQTPSIAERLRQIVEAEGVSADREALEVLARRAAGSMRDSQSLLEQLLASGTKITLADVHHLLGTAASGRLEQMARHLVDRNAAGALAELDSALAEGVETGQLLDQLLGYFRDCLVASVGCPAEAFLHTSTEGRDAVLQASRRLGVETLLAVMQILDQTMARLRYSTHVRVLAELALVRISLLEDLDQLPVLIHQLREGLPPAVIAQPRVAGPSSVPAEVQTAATDRTAAIEVVAPVGEDGKKKEPVAPIEAVIGSSHAAIESALPNVVPPVPATALNSETADQLWKQALDRIEDMTRDMASMCDRIAISAPNRLVVSFREKYNSCRLFCERPEQLNKLERALAEEAGQMVRIEFAVLPDAVLPDQGEVGAATSPHQKSAPTMRERLQEKSQHPLVRRAMDLFQAVPVRVDGEQE